MPTKKPENGFSQPHQNEWAKALPSVCSKGQCLHPRRGSSKDMPAEERENPADDRERNARLLDRPGRVNRVFISANCFGKGEKFISSGSRLFVPSRGMFRLSVEYITVGKFYLITFAFPLSSHVDHFREAAKARRF